MKLISNLDAMYNWLNNSKTGDKAVYYHGMLMADKERFFAGGGTGDKMPEPMKSAKAAWNAYMEGVVYLVQDRKGHMKYDYIAVRA